MNDNQNKEKKLIVINLYGSPGAGKSTLAAYTFSKLKMLGVNCELVTEFAKDKVWEKNNTALDNQIYIFAKQQYRIARCAGKVDVVITDSPLLLSGFYNKDPDIDKPLKDLIYQINKKYDNRYYYVRRVKKYNPAGRLQTEEESNSYGNLIKELLAQYNVKYREIDGDLMSADVIVEELRSSIGLDENNMKVS